MAAFRRTVVSRIELTAIRKMEAILDSVARDLALKETSGFAARFDAIDLIEFHVVNRIEDLQDEFGERAELAPLKGRALALCAELDKGNRAVIEELRAEVRSGGARGDELRRVFERLGCLARDSGTRRVMYDALDAFVRGLLDAGPVPEESIKSDPEMVPLQATPARVVLELAEKAGVTARDTFYDIGSGLGQVAMLMHLITGASAYGIEVEPNYCDYAARCAADLGLKSVTFINADARRVRYEKGTVFFLYTPFRGQMLKEVLDRLEFDTRGRSVRLGTYGPCTQIVAEENWLGPVEPVIEDGLAVYERVT